MGKLIFEYAVMNSGKTAKLLQKDFDYNRIGKKTLLLKPSIDTRDKDIIRSRNGMEKKCILVDENTKLFDLIVSSNNEKVDIVFIDECQFLTNEQVMELRKIANMEDSKNILIYCFGLKTDYMGKLFEASKTLLEQADEINESNTFCHCGEKATMNLKYDAKTGKAIKNGKQIDCGSEEKYVPVCNKHWHQGKVFAD